MDTGWDLYFTKGLPKVTRDLDTELGTADPTLIMGLIPPKGHRVLTEAEQLAKQGLVPRLTEALNTEAKALQELSRVTPGAISGEVVKGVKLMRGIDQFIDADPELAARVAKGDLDLQAEMTMMARRNLTADGILPEDTVDQAIALAASNRTPKQLTKALTDLAKSTLGEVSGEHPVAGLGRDDHRLGGNHQEPHRPHQGLQGLPQGPRAAEGHPCWQSEQVPVPHGVLPWIRPGG